MAASREAVAELQRMLEHTRDELASARLNAADAKRVERLEETLHEQTLLVSRALAAIALAALPTTPISSKDAALGRTAAGSAIPGMAGRSTAARGTRPTWGAAASSSPGGQGKPSKADTLGNYVERRRQYTEAVEYCRSHKCGGKKAMQSGRFPLCNAKGIQDRLSGRVNHENTFEKRRILTHAEEEHLAQWLAKSVEPDESKKRRSRQLHKQYICDLLNKRKTRFRTSNGVEGMELSEVAEQALAAGGPDKRWFQRFFQKWNGVIEEIRAGGGGATPAKPVSSSDVPAPAEAERAVSGSGGGQAPGKLQAEVIQAASEPPAKPTGSGSVKCE